MQQMTRRLSATLLAALLTACAAQPESAEDDVVSDFIAVAELQALDAVRFRDQFNTRPLAGRYALLRARDNHYLVQFRRRCRELYENNFPPDIRHERNTLRPGIDTIRGCRIDQIFSVEESQAAELKILADGLDNE